MSNEVYQPLAIELDGCYKKSFSELDAGLQVRVKRAFNPGWDDLTESQRRSIALYHDYGSDPKHEPVLYFELWQFMDTLSAMESKARVESKEAVALVIVDVKKQIESLLNNDRETVGKEIQELRSKVAVDERPLSSIERKTTVKIIHALAKNGYKYPSHGALAEIVRDFQTNDNGVTENTLTKYLKEFDSL